MKPLETLLENAARSNKTIVLSEGNDIRILEAAAEARKQGIARIVLVGDVAGMRQHYDTMNYVPDDGLEFHDPRTSEHFEELAELLFERRKHKGMTLDKARESLTNPYVYSALLVKSGRADGTVGGAAASTAEVVRTALQIIGAKPGSSLVSSFFLMLFCQDHHVKKGAHIFADSGLVVEPSAEDMAQIAVDSAASFAGLTGETPRVAMLSFSTKGSASHEKVSKVVRATELAKTAAPELLIDGELQFDAAFVPHVAAAKASDSPLGGNANIFVFPNLESGNIAYKIAQRVGGAAAIGPVLQGLDRPANDLSRGCSAEDVLHMVAVTAAQAETTPA